MSHRRILAAILISCFLIASVSATFEELAATLHRLGSPRTPSHLKHRSKRAKMARQFLSAHNNIRALFGLEPLRWNRSLARYARRWANQRAQDCALQHSPNRPYGENMFWSLKGNWGPKAVVRIWAEEYTFYDAAKNECKNGEMCGHYTQIIWRKTTQLGCGTVKCRDKKGYLYVCSYSPPGNIYYQGPFGGRFARSIVKPPGTP